MSSQTHSLLRHLHRLTMPAIPDAALLARWLERRDEAAFAELVGRHGPMVLGLCRRILGDAQHAEDVFQATFLTLARKAARLRRPDALPSFLYGIALRLARKARGAAARHSLQPLADAAEPADPQPHPLDVLSGRELLTLVDAEIARLPEVYRLPVLLCVLQERSVEEAARTLGWSAGSVRGRLARGRERLRQRLSRRGVTLSVGVIALLPPSAVPEYLRAAALRNLTMPTSATVNALTAASMPNLKALCLGLFVLSAGLGAGLPFFQAPKAETPATAAPPAQAQANNEPRRDRYGDPLPQGAVARLGTLRYRLDTDFVSVDELTFAPDGKTLAAASHHGLWLFDAATGKPAKSFRPPNTGFQHLAFSADGKRLMTAAKVQLPGSWKNVVQIWDVAGGRKASELELKNVRWLGWSAEGQPQAVCLSKGEISLHETATGWKRRFTAKDLPDSLQSRGQFGGALVNFHCAAAKNVLAAGDNKGVIHVWDIISGAERWLLKTGGVLTGGVFVNSLALSADGRWLASLSRDAANKIVVQLWDLTTGKATHAVAADQTFLHAVAFTPDGKTLATVDRQEVRFWDAASGRERGRTQGEGRTFAASIAFTPDSKTMAAAEMYGGAIHLWDMATGKCKPEAEGHSTSWPGTPAFSPDGGRVATFGVLDGTIRVWEAATGRPLTRIRRSPRNVTACAFLGDGRTVLSRWNDTLLAFDAATGRELDAPKLNDPDAPNLSQKGEHLHLSDDGQKAITINRDGTMTGWDTATWKQRFHRRLGIQGVYGIVSADAAQLALPHAESL